MIKPNIEIKAIKYVPHYDETGEGYTVIVINKASGSWLQTHIYCTGCGKGNVYRTSENGPWLHIKCPHCDTISAHYFEEGDSQ